MENTDTGKNNNCFQMTEQLVSKKVHQIILLMATNKLKGSAQLRRTSEPCNHVLFV